MQSGTNSKAWAGWDGKEILIAEAEAILRSTDPLDAALQAVTCKGSGSKHPGLVKPVWHAVPPGRREDPAGYWRPDRQFLSELLSRTVEIRSRRWNAERREIARWPSTWQDLIRGAYPALSVHFACRQGWGDLLAAAAGFIHDIEPEAPWLSTDIKEKFGSLRWYWSGDLHELSAEVIDCAEYLSHSICEICGGPGSQRGGGWIMTLCDHHDADRSWRDWIDD